MKHLYLIMSLHLVMLFSSKLNALEGSPICINKSLQVTTNLGEQNKVIYLNIDNKIMDFEIRHLHGIDGLQVYSYNVEEQEKNKKYKITLEYDEPSGESFFVISVVFKNETNYTKREVISVSVGELSDSQQEQRSKSIKYLNSGSKEINSHGKIQVGKLRVHELPLIEN